MIEVKLLFPASYRRDNLSFVRGEVRSVPAEVARDLLSSGHFEQVSDSSVSPGEPERGGGIKVIRKAKKPEAEVEAAPEPAPVEDDTAGAVEV